ncbi:MAG: sulfatase-like hydrolase/transferase [Candidatus Latescibacteria bacterium]|nr:sulfatase-like hydrolase/transferase [Candidatus Latescibacterota bacterium]
MANPSTDERPNIVLIMSDQHNPSVLGCAGNPIVQTPNLDGLAGQGTRFTNAYCPYPLCVPSRSAFVAAQYASDIGIYDNGGLLSSEVPTFAHALGAAGYEAVMCGRMHFGGPDPFHGFERRIHGECGSRKVLSQEVLGTGYNRTNGQTKYAVQVSGYGQTGYQLYDQSVTEAACEFISPGNGSDRPYALVVGLMLPHNPLICSKELFDYYMARIEPPEPVSADYLEALHPAMLKWRERRGVEDLTPEQNQRGLATYYGLTTELDRNIGRILEAIASSPDADRTVVLYTSDHGDMACEHGMWWKSSFYEGSNGIPLIASWPGRIAEGIEQKGVVSLIDVGPTLLDLIGADPMPDVAGRAFTRLLRDGNDEGWDHEVFSEYIGLWGDQPGSMVRKGPWKLNYYHETNSYQLFNLDCDPGELDDRARDPECREVVDTLSRRIHDRWSAERILDALDRQTRARGLIRSCGHPPVPHPVPVYEPPDEASQFDFSQLPIDPR